MSERAGKGYHHSQNMTAAGLNLSLSNGDFLSSRLTSYQTAPSGDDTPTAAPESHGPWENPYLRSTSLASSQVALPSCAYLLINLFLLIQ